jgi:glucoamylase
LLLSAIHRRPIDDAIMSSADAAQFSVTDKRVLATAQALRAAFKAQYAVNGRPGEPGVAIGRYPEDSYYGGNPWFLITAGFAQLDYMAGSEFARRGDMPIDSEDLAFFRELLDPADQDLLHAGSTVKKSEPLFGKLISGLRAQGDSYLAEVRAHAGADGSLSE